MIVKEKNLERVHQDQHQGSQEDHQRNGDVVVKTPLNRYLHRLQPVPKRNVEVILSIPGQTSLKDAIAEELQPKTRSKTVSKTREPKMVTPRNASVGKASTIKQVRVNTLVADMEIEKKKTKRNLKIKISHAGVIANMQVEKTLTAEKDTNQR